MTKYRGWVVITTINEGKYTTTKEYTSWDSFHELLEDLPKEGLVKFLISVDQPSDSEYE
jgi:hypothetical protein